MQLLTIYSNELCFDSVLLRLLFVTVPEGDDSAKKSNLVMKSKNNAVLLAHACVFQLEVQVEVEVEV